MVWRMNPDDCHCETCDGGTKAQKGYFGGTYCPCDCHILKGKERETFVTERMKTHQDALTRLIDAAMSQQEKRDG